MAAQISPWTRPRREVHVVIFDFLFLWVLCRLFKEGHALMFCDMIILWVTMTPWLYFHLFPFTSHYHSIISFFTMTLISSLVDLFWFPLFMFSLSLFLSLFCSLSLSFSLTLAGWLITGRNFHFLCAGHMTAVWVWSAEGSACWVGSGLGFSFAYSHTLATWKNTHGPP